VATFIPQLVCLSVIAVLKKPFGYYVAVLCLTFCICCGWDVGVERNAALRSAFAVLCSHAAHLVVDLFSTRYALTVKWRESDVAKSVACR